MTVMTWVMDGLLAAMAAAMLIKGKYGITRQLAAAPLVLAVLDAAFAGQIQPMLTPVLSWLLLGLEQGAPPPAAAQPGSLRAGNG